MDVVICIVLVLDEQPELLLRSRTQIVLVGNIPFILFLLPKVMQHLDPFRVLQPNSLFREDEIPMKEESFHDLDLRSRYTDRGHKNRTEPYLISELLLETTEHGVDDIKNLFIMVRERHL